ncbi:hypothetical protein [Altererythrobacter sp. Root672]|uniref:hypothetical protein n=1 Tax=Altererythrobacter sp. Root672 TaxID=1736584 RepID=UPI0006F4F683|nr:hypothetical protein [Altererythrobacter sp. Root672]KRA83109.1 hypothetical protein ASD76_03285 [Altererythrobacter sp. Root672]
MQIIYSVWIILVVAVGLNGFAAGVAAALSVWGPAWKRPSRILVAAASAGFLPFGVLIPATFLELSSGMKESTYLALGFGVMFVIATVVSLPGAIVVSRKLERPSDDFLAFE